MSSIYSLVKIKGEAIMNLIQAKTHLTNKIHALLSKTDKIRMVKVAALKTKAEFKDLYQQEPEKVAAIAKSMMEKGFDKSQPIIVLHDNSILDGNSRYMAAIKAGLEEIPVIYKEFSSVDEALVYEEKLQLNRRNLSDSEKMIHLENLLKLRSKAKSSGGNLKEFSDDQLAAKLRTSPRQVQKMKEVEAKATPEQLEAIRRNETTMAKVHAEIKKKEGLSRKPPKKKPDLDAFKAGIETALEVLKKKISEEEYSELEKTLLAECLSIYNTRELK